jgi:hypothetical protein
MAQVPHWTLKGDWFDVCKCTIPCPCTFAQAPTTGDCEGILAWHIREGRYGDLRLDGLNLVGVSSFEGNVWDGAKAVMGLYMDARADERQRKALATIFGGEAGGWPGFFAQVIGDFRGVEYVPIEFELADDLAYWTAKVPGRVSARGDALTGPTTLPGQRVQTINPPGCETGPNGVATWGTATESKAKGFGLQFEWVGRSSKHIPFDWSGPDEA